MGKSGVLEHKSGNISEMRKDRGKVTRESLWELTNSLSNGTTPTPYSLLFPKIGGSQPPQKTPIAIISGSGEATDFKSGYYIHRVHPNKSSLAILEKRKRERIQGLSKICGYPLLSQERVKLRTSNLGLATSDAELTLTITLTETVTDSRTLTNFHCYGAIRRCFHPGG